MDTMADKENHRHGDDSIGGSKFGSSINPLVFQEHQTSWRHLHSRSPAPTALSIRPEITLSHPSSPPIFGSSPRRGHRRTDTILYNPVMASETSFWMSHSPQSRPITPHSSDGYSGDIENSPDVISLDDCSGDGVADGDDGPTPRAKKRLTAIKEGTPQEECSDYETAEEDEKTVKKGVNASAFAQKRKIANRLPPGLAVQTNLPFRESPGRRRAISTPTRLDHAVMNTKNEANGVRAASGRFDTS